MMLFKLLLAHCLADFPLQGDFLSRAKNQTNPIPGVDWWICLLAHSIIHGGFVALITGSVALGVFEIVIHFAIDYGKSAGWYGFGFDQLLHVLLKAGYFVGMQA